jgi:hypothetical protein
MSFDPSRESYAHPACKTLPCSCVWTHRPLQVLTFPCRFCAATFVHLGDYEAHRLDAHERPLRTAAGVVMALPLLVPLRTANGTGGPHGHDR